MKKRSVASGALIVVILIVLGLGVAYYLNTESAKRQNAAESARQENMPPLAVETDKAPVDDAPNPGMYVDYSDDVIESTDGKKVLFFHAPWCPQCRAIDSDIKAQSSLPADTTIIKVDYDSHQDLRQKYGVTLQTTFVEVNDVGNFIQKYVAYNEPNYTAVKENILE